MILILEAGDRLAIVTPELADFGGEIPFGERQKLANRLYAGLCGVMILRKGETLWEVYRRAPEGHPEWVNKLEREAGIMALRLLG